MPERAPSPSLRISRTKPRRRRVFRALLLLIVVAFGAFYITSLNASRHRLDVTLLNRTDGAITEVSFGDPSPVTPFDRIENGARVQISVPFTDVLVVSFRGPDHQFRTRDFACHDVWGLSHRLEITLEKKVPYVSRLSTYQMSWLIGAKTTHRQPYNFGDPMKLYPPAEPDIPNLESPR